jgi:RND family efflux transporter MFP subunit
LFDPDRWSPAPETCVRRSNAGASGCPGGAGQQQDVPIYGEWIGTLAGQVNANVQAQISGYLLKRDYQEGATVRTGPLLFEIDPRPFQGPFQTALDQAEGPLAQAIAQLANAEAVQHRDQLDVERYTPLAKEQAASQQDLDNANQNNLAAKSTVATDQAQIKSAQAAVETAKLNLGFTSVSSPVNGIADVAKAQVGDLVSPKSGTLTTVSTLDPIRDYFTVSEQDYLQLKGQFSGSDRQGWKLQLILADGTTYPHEGVFYFVGRAVDQNTGSIQLAALFPNPGNMLRPGQYGKVRAVVRTVKGASLVPQAAGADLQGSYQVSVVGQDNRIAMRPVRVGERVGTRCLSPPITTTMPPAISRRLSRLITFGNRRIPDIGAPKQQIRHLSQSWTKRKSPRGGA